MPGSRIKLAARILEDKTGPVDAWKFPSAVLPNFKMKIAANVLGDKKGLLDQLEVSGVMPNFEMKIAAIMLEYSEVSVYVLEMPVANMADFTNNMES